MAVISTGDKKLRELIVYTASQCADDKNFGVTKLNKILFFADFYYFLQEGKSISGKKYIKKRYGPVPQGVEKLQKEMISKGDIGLAIAQSGPYPQKRVVALRQAKLDDFEPEAIGFLSKIIQQYCFEHKITASTLSDFSHDFLGWKIADDNEEIPYQTIFLKRAGKQILTPSLIERAKAVYQSLSPAHVAA